MSQKIEGLEMLAIDYVNAQSRRRSAEADVDVAERRLRDAQDAAHEAKREEYRTATALAEFAAEQFQPGLPADPEEDQ